MAARDADTGACIDADTGSGPTPPSPPPGRGNGGRGNGGRGGRGGRATCISRTHPGGAASRHPPASRDSPPQPRYLRPDRPRRGASPGRHGLLPERDSGEKTTHGLLPERGRRCVTRREIPEMTQAMTHGLRTACSRRGVPHAAAGVSLGRHPERRTLMTRTRQRTWPYCPTRTRQPAAGPGLRGLRGRRGEPGGSPGRVGVV